jgi:hypothetical protein
MGFRPGTGEFNCNVCKVVTFEKQLQLHVFLGFPSVCVCFYLIISIRVIANSHVIIYGAPHSTFREQTLEVEQTYQLPAGIAVYRVYQKSCAGHNLYF